MAGMTLDLKDFERQIEQKKKEILSGVQDGLKLLAPILEGRMHFYLEEYVYDSYISGSKNPDKYERTYKLLESIKAEVIGSTLYVYSGEGVPYAERVLKGNEVIPYDYPWVPAGSTGDFRPSRDWVTPTTQEIINHFQQGGYLLPIMIQAIQKKI
jgi:hypothetical protein